MKAGDVVRIPMGTLTAKLEVTEIDDASRTGSMKFVELFKTKGHKPEDNGFGLCVHCGRRVHFVETVYLIPRTPPEGYWRHNPIARLRPIHDNDRTHCSSCGRRFQAYELKPGDGRCKECAP